MGTMFNPCDVLMLDVDGVLVSLHSKHANERLLALLAQRLQCGTFVTFNSGRPPSAVNELVLALLEQRLKDKQALSRVMVVGEKGGAWANYAQDGILQTVFDTALTVPVQLASAMRELVEYPEFIRLMHIESGKRTMISAIKRNGVSLDAFQQVQVRFASLAQQGIAALGLDADWKIDVVSDSTEIEHRSATKAKGSHMIMRWLQSQGVWPKRIVAIEDSPSGITMAEALHEMRVPVEFVFTGTRPLPRQDYTFSIVQTERKFEQGTLDYLTRYQDTHALHIGAGGASWH